MPYKSSKINIANTSYDRRVKLTNEQKEEVVALHNSGWSQRKLAKEFGVSRSLIVFIIDTERKARAKELLRLRKQDGRYKPTKDDWAATMREHRKYKQELFIKNKIQL